MLQVENLHVSYGAVAALRGVSIEVAAGEAVSVVGPNGAGKTSLMHAVTGVVRPQAGSIRFDGQPLAGQRVDRIAARGISLVPEGRDIFSSLTVGENLRLARAARRDGASYRADLAAVLEHFPVLRQRLDASAGKLSGGEQQQLAIARALLTRPRLLLLDEPSLGLAPRVIDTVYQILARLRAEGLTMLVVEQNAARALGIADRTYVLRSGVIELSGRADELRRSPQFEEAYFGFGREPAP